MDEQKVDMFIISNGKYFESRQLPAIRQRLLALSDSKWSVILTLQFKDPILAFIISLLIGGFGIDRFYIGDIGLGVAKLFTFGGFGIWTILDWFLIMGVAKDKNVQIMKPFLLRPH